MTDTDSTPTTTPTTSSTPPTSTPPTDNQSRTPFQELTLHVLPWADPVLDDLGHDPRSLYVERFWVSVLGPSATLLLRRLAMGLDAAPDGFELDTVACALELGLGTRGGRGGPFWKTLDRTARFGATHRNGPVLMVRRHLAPLTSRQVGRLPNHLQVAHHRFMARQAVDRGSVNPPAA